MHSSCHVDQHMATAWWPAVAAHVDITLELLGSRAGACEDGSAVAVLLCIHDLDGLVQRLRLHHGVKG